MGTKLNQVIAIEKGLKNKVNSEVSDLYKVVQKPALFEGFKKTYQPNVEGGESQPDQAQRVQYNARELLRQSTTRIAELMDVTAQKDYANCAAKADVVVDGKTVVTQAPVTYLLFLEKQLTDIRSFIDKLPVLDLSETWEFDNNSQQYRSGEVRTSRTKKNQKPLVLYPATDKHPAQTQLITEDEVVGTWVNVKFSGAVSTPLKARLMDKVERLITAVKFARESANMVEAPPVSVGQAVMDYLLSE